MVAENIFELAFVCPRSPIGNFACKIKVVCNHRLATNKYLRVVKFDKELGLISLITIFLEAWRNKWILMAARSL